MVQRNSRPESSHHAVKVRPTPSLQFPWRKSHRHPESRRRAIVGRSGKGELEIRTHDADGGVGLAVQWDGPPDDTCFASKSALPQGIAEDGHVMPRRILPRSKVPAECW